MNNINLKKREKIITVVLIIAIIIVGIFLYNLINKRREEASKAIITLDIPDNLAISQTITAPININTQGQTINAAEVYLNFDKNALEVSEVIKDGSIFQLWIKDQPSFSNEKGIVSFAGGLPTPGFKGIGKIGTIKFKLKQPTLTTLTFDNKTRALLNDGKGTAITLKLEPIKLKID